MIIQLTLELSDLSLDLALLVQQPLHAGTLALGLIVHLITINGQTIFYIIEEAPNHQDDITW